VETHREETKRTFKEYRWIDRINQDFEKLGIPNWEEKVQNRKEWKEVLVMANTLEEL